jgi:NAD(P)-dependent dehydrogenase (short-subunit alcohol dehydrogenase family)
MLSDLASIIGCQIPVSGAREEASMGRQRVSGGRWTAADIPDQSGRIAVVTGGNSGLGLETAKELARRGSTVVLACRDLDKAERAAGQIHGEIGHADVRRVRLDLASLASVREAAGEIRSTYPRLNLLINNAGVMQVPNQRTEDGFEPILATNHLGHFAFTGLVLDRLLATPGARIVTVSSPAHRRGTTRYFDDLQSERTYGSMKAYDHYDQSKLANLLFTYELQAHLEAAGAAASALAAYPGNVRTGLYRNHPLPVRVIASPRLRILTFWFAEDPPMGALPTLRAAVDPAALGGECYGPSGRFDTGYPIRVETSPASHDVAAQRTLWEISEQLTGVSFRVAVPSDQRPSMANVYDVAGPD